MASREAIALVLVSEDRRVGRPVVEHAVSWMLPKKHFDSRPTVAPHDLAGASDWTHTAVCNMVVCMNVDRLSITLDPRLGAAARKAAKRAKVSLSTWIAEATADRVRNELLGEALDRWEAEEGALTQEDLDRASEDLGLSRRRKARRA
jgi:hypothetical protein